MLESVGKLTFWGVRGSIPTPDRNTWRYGGNTACLEFTAPGGTRIVLDCGTGLRVLGNYWGNVLSEEPVEASVLVTHYHWDHIQGIPFFHPFFEPRNQFHFYSFQSKHLCPGTLQHVIEGQLANPYFPVDVSMMSSRRTFREISGGDQFEIDNVRIKACWLNHPQGCLGYRLETDAGTVVYATDNEPGVPQLDDALRELAQGADVYIHDAQYSPEQLASSRKGWGHSSWLEGAKIARESGAKNLVLFHHDPDSSDRMIDGFLQAARQEFHSTWSATEGMTLLLRGNRVDVNLPDTRTSPRRSMALCANVTGQSENGTPFEEKVTLRDISLQGAFLNLSHCPRLQSELKLVIQQRTEDQMATPIALRGTVVHREFGTGKKRHGVGIVFTDDSASPIRD